MSGTNSRLCIPTCVTRHVCCRFIQRARKELVRQAASAHREKAVYKFLLKKSGSSSAHTQIKFIWVNFLSSSLSAGNWFVSFVGIMLLLLPDVSLSHRGAAFLRSFGSHSLNSTRSLYTCHVMLVDARPLHLNIQKMHAVHGCVYAAFYI